MKKIYKLNEVFTESQSLGQRSWGSEDLIYASPGCYTFKILKVKAGSKGGLQYHRKKDEVTFIVSGKLKVLIDLNDGNGLQDFVIGEGEWIRFPTGMVHQEEALTDVVRIEASSPFLNDRVRMEEEYGFGEPIGLPTTDLDEIEKI